MPAVLLTRPLASSEALASQLETLGYRCVIDPMLIIEPVAAFYPDLTNIQAVMVTSGNALDAASISPAMLALPCFCVGVKTADKARACGFQLTFHTASDGAELAQLIGETLIDKSKAILHIAGRNIDSKAHSALTTAGFTVTPWVVYAAHSATQFAASTLDFLKWHKLAAALFFSTRSAESFAALIRANRLEACCQSLDAIGFSEAVTSALKNLPWRRLKAAASPTEDAVIACLNEMHPIA